MRNVTITLDDDTALWARIEAARADTSLSRFVGGLLREQMQRRSRYEEARRAFMEYRPSSSLSGGAPYPSRDEIHER
ncbi:MAG: CopG family transcriptional regulator [Chloroflexi bacterium]|nr:CopG family transcriptional regulator [Chloroflexota bacterium]